MTLPDINEWTKNPIDPAGLSDSAKARRPILAKYADGGPILVQAASNLTEEAATARPGPGDWSLAQVVAHLLDADLVLTHRMKQIIADESPKLGSFDENRWVDHLLSGEMPPAEAAALFAANRAWMARLLGKLGDDAFRRAGMHDEAGRLTLAQVVVRSIHHLDYHLKFIYAKRANLGLAIYPRYASNPGY